MKLFPIAVYRRWLLLVAAFSGAVMSFLAWFVHPGYLDKICANDTTQDCLYYWGGLTYDLQNEFFLKSLIIVPLILIFFTERVFKWWKWFALIAVPFLIWNLNNQPLSPSEHYVPESWVPTMNQAGGFLSRLPPAGQARGRVHRGDPCAKADGHQPVPCLENLEAFR